MKKLLLSFTLIILSFYLSASDITLRVGDCDLTGYEPGDKVYIPITIDAITPGEEIGGWQLFIWHNETIITWDGTTSNPYPGINYLNPLFPMSAAAVFNVNPGSEFVYLWGDGSAFANLTGYTFPVTIVELIFTYHGGLNPGESSPLIWGTQGKYKDNLSGKGTTEVFTWEEFDYFYLTLINGSVYMTNQGLAKLELPNLEIAILNIGDDITIPVKLLNKTAQRLITGLEFYIAYDHTLFSWKGTSGNPLSGVQNFHVNLPYNPTVWTFGDNGSELFAYWYDPGGLGIDMNNGDVFFEYVLTYNGGFDPGQVSPFTWGSSSKSDVLTGSKGQTGMTDQNYESYLLTLYNGGILYTGSSTVDLKAFLEGPFENGEMTPYLNAPGVLTLTQPYNTTPWNYAGTESVTTIPNNSIVDWILVELRESSGDATSAGPSAIVSRQAGFITRNGYIVSVDGINPLIFNYYSNKNVFAVIRHRNHLNVMSADPLIRTGEFFQYNYTDAADKAFGGSNAQKELAPGIWGLIAGDGDADNKISNNDKTNIWKPQAATTGYKKGDFNMDKQVENTDKNDYWFPNINKVSLVPLFSTCPGVPFLSYQGLFYNTLNPQ